MSPETGGEVGRHNPYGEIQLYGRPAAEVASGAETRRVENVQVNNVVFGLVLTPLERQKLRSQMTTAEGLTADIGEGITRLRPQIEVASWLHPIIERAKATGRRSVVVPAGYRDGLAGALSKLPLTEMWDLQAVLGRDPDGKVNVDGVKTLYASNKGNFRTGMKSTMDAVEERDRALTSIGELLDNVLGEVADYRPRLRRLKRLAQFQADEMPKQTRWPRSEEIGQSAIEFVVTRGGFEFPILFADGLIPDDPTDIEIYLTDPPDGLK